MYLRLKQSLYSALRPSIRPATRQLATSACAQRGAVGSLPSEGLRAEGGHQSVSDSYFVSKNSLKTLFDCLRLALITLIALQWLAGLVAFSHGAGRVRGTDCPAALQVLLVLRPQPEGLPSFCAARSEKMSYFKLFRSTKCV